MAHLCPQCFDNTVLGRRITELRRNRDMPRCLFHRNRKGLPINEIAGIVDPVLRANYTHATGAFGIMGGSPFRDLLADLTGAVDDEVVAVLADALMDGEEVDVRDGDVPFYGDDQNYEHLEPDGYLQSQLWEEFRYSIIHGRRFFNLKASELLSQIFDKVHLQTDEAKQPALYTVDESTRLYRARQVKTMVDAERLSNDPAREIGPPPQHLRSAGRMNAAGIGAFYGALDEDTCIAELRPPVGSLVCIAEFRPVRPIYVLDLTRFEAPGRHIDMFARHYASRTTQWAFMQSFQHEISKPILKDDEHLEYVPAQVVAEYLTGSPVSFRGEDRRIEGLVYRSAQHAGGRNLVLFGEAGRVIGGHAPTGSPSGGAFSDIEIPSLAPATTASSGLEASAGSFRIRSVVSATYASEEEHMTAGGGPDF